MSIQNSIVTIYPTHAEADQALEDLRRRGVDTHKLSIIAKGYHTDDHVLGYYNIFVALRRSGSRGNCLTLV